MATDLQLKAALRDLNSFSAHNAEAALRTSDVTRMAAARPPQDNDLEAQDLQELHSSDLYATLDHLSSPAQFPVSSNRMLELKKTEFWFSLGIFVYAKGIVLDSDSLAAHTQWLRDIISYIRDNGVIPPECTSDTAVTRILTALAYQHRFRQHMRELRAASIKDFPRLLPDLVAYICHDHIEPPHERQLAGHVVMTEDDSPPDAVRVPPARRMQPTQTRKPAPVSAGPSEAASAEHIAAEPLVTQPTSAQSTSVVQPSSAQFTSASCTSAEPTIVQTDAANPPRSVPPTSDDPPPYKARLHKASIEYLDNGRADGVWTDLVCDTFAVALHWKNAPAAQRRMEVLQFTLAQIKELKSVETPYFDGMSEARLRSVLDADPGFVAVMDELLRSVDGDYSLFARILRRIVNHLCQPRKRAQGGSSRQVRFAPF